MKKLPLTLIVCAMFILVSGTTSFAQQKIGHIDTQAVLQLMPERDSAAKIYEKFDAEIKKNYESMDVVYRNLAETYTKQKDSLSSFIRTAKEAELVDMQGKIQNFATVAQQELDKKQTELMTPIVAKLKNAIKAVAEANKFTYILDTQSQTSIVVYIPEDESLNILPLVKAKLGIK
ncbi:MAG: OmpH family outer membrane protein [Bacteroidia bacterium]|nr:OmpH family outer membrane protein [Bacteroidia bacterium]